MHTLASLLGAEVAIQDSLSKAGGLHFLVVKFTKCGSVGPALLIMELIFTLQSLAAEVTADLVECTLYLFLLIPARASVHFHHLAIVSTLALLCGASKEISSLFCL